MQTLFQDLRYSLRQLIKSPGFTLTAVISLALGIGATTAVFSVIYAALLNPYPFRASDRIVRLTVTSKAGAGNRGGTIAIRSRRSGGAKCAIPVRTNIAATPTAIAAVQLLT